MFNSAGVHMTILLIAYDLEKVETSRTVSKVIRAIGARWARPLANVWFVDTELVPADVEARLSPLLGIDDGLMVQKVDCEAVGYNTSMRWTPNSKPAAVVGASSTDNLPPCEIIAWPGRLADAA